MTKMGYPYDNDFLKNALRKLIKQQGWDDNDMGGLARDFICDAHQTEAFLVYLNQVIEGEI